MRGGVRVFEWAGGLDGGKILLGFSLVWDDCRWCNCRPWPRMKGNEINREDHSARFFVSRGRDIGGPYSESEMWQLCREGAFLDTDLACLEGASQWGGVYEVLHELEKETIPKASAWKRKFAERKYAGLHAIGLGLVDRHILKEWAKYYVICLMGLYAFVLAFDLFSYIKGLLNRGLSTMDMAYYYILRAPDMIWGIMPIVMGLSVLAMVSNLARANEFVAMKVAGMSPARIMRPCLMVAVLIGAAHFSFTEWVAPRCGAVLHGPVVVRIKNHMDAVENGIMKPFAIQNIQKSQSISGAWFDMKQNVVHRPFVEWADTAGNISTIFPAKPGDSHGHWIDGKWRLENVAFQFRLASDELPTVNLKFIASTNVVLSGLTPDQIHSICWVQQLNKRKQKQQLKLSLSSIQKFRREARFMAGTGDARWLENRLATEFHERFARPWIYVLIVLIPFYMGPRTGRDNTMIRAGICIGCTVLVLLLQKVFFSLGVGGILPPMMAAWAVIGIFMVGFSYLYVARALGLKSGVSIS